MALASVGKAVDYDVLVFWTLRGLGSEYDSIVAAINSRPDPLSLEEVCGLFLDFELRLTSSSRQQPAAAFLAFPIGSCGPLSAQVLAPSTGCGSPPTVGGLANTRGDGGGRRGPLLAEAVIVPSHRLSLLPMLSVTDVGILITKPTHVGLRMMLSNLSRLSMQ